MLWADTEFIREVAQDQQKMVLGMTASFGEIDPGTATTSSHTRSMSQKVIATAEVMDLCSAAPSMLSLSASKFTWEGR